MDTTDGSTRFAIPATELAGRSIVEFDCTNLVEKPKSDPLDDAPNAPAITPTIMASTIALRSEIVLPL
jgi:hypothetical protein